MFFWNAHTIVQSFGLPSFTQLPTLLHSTSCYILHPATSCCYPLSTSNTLPFPLPLTTHPLLWNHDDQIDLKPAFQSKAVTVKQPLFIIKTGNLLLLNLCVWQHNVHTRDWGSLYQRECNTHCTSPSRNQLYWHHSRHQHALGSTKGHQLTSRHQHTLASTMAATNMQWLAPGGRLACCSLGGIAPSRPPTTDNCYSLNHISLSSSSINVKHISNVHSDIHLLILT